MVNTWSLNLHAKSLRVRLPLPAPTPTPTMNLAPSQVFLPQTAELFARFVLTKCGIRCYTPTIDSGVDLLVKTETGLKTVQVKSSFYRNPAGEHAFALRRTRFNATGSRKVAYSDQECDYFLYADNGRFWIIPRAELKGRKSVVPAKIFPQFEYALPQYT